MTIKHISAITFAVQDMTQANQFYQKLGFQLLNGGDSSSFSCLRAGDAIVNLAHVQSYKGHWWGRVIFRVEDVDEHYRNLTAKGLNPLPPRDADWGERFFHLTDPDGHELSFAKLLPSKK